MTKNKIKSILLIVVILIIIIIVLVFNLNKTNNKISSNIKEISISKKQVNDKVNDEKYIIIKSIDEYNEVMTDNEENNLDFKKHNYILVPISYDSCGEKDLELTEYNMNNNELKITIEYKASCGVCAPLYNYYLFETDKNTTNIDLEVNYKRKNDIKCDENISYKPLIYFYPEKEMDVEVKVSKPNLLTTTYPKYNDGWKIHLLEDGNIISNNRTYYGLYWEGLNNFNYKVDEGFVVKKEDTIGFLEEKLTILGLNDREINEFIIYWLPKLEENKYNYIKFETIENINEQMGLEIKPRPDTLIRVFMEYLPLKKKIDVKEQKLSTPIRKGFTVVEWGGSEIK